MCQGPQDATSCVRSSATETPHHTGHSNGHAVEFQSRS